MGDMCQCSMPRNVGKGLLAQGGGVATGVEEEEGLGGEEAGLAVGEVGDEEEAHHVSYACEHSDAMSPFFYFNTFYFVNCAFLCCFFRWTRLWRPWRWVWFQSC